MILTSIIILCYKKKYLLYGNINNRGKSRSFLKLKPAKQKRMTSNIPTYRYIYFYMLRREVTKYLSLFSP